MLGDGIECIFNIYEALGIWDETLLKIPVDEADSDEQTLRPQNKCTNIALF